MAQARLSMRKIRETLRLKYEAGLSDRRMATAIGSSRSTVQECLRRCREAGLGWCRNREIRNMFVVAPGS